MLTSQTAFAWRSFRFLVPTMTTAGWMSGMNGPYLFIAFWNFSKTA